MKRPPLVRIPSSAVAASVLLLAACGQATRPQHARTGNRPRPLSTRDQSTRAARPRRCRPAPIHRGTPPAWTASAWADSSPNFTAPYALSSGDAAAAVMFVNQLRAGHPTNPANKVLWIVRYPRNGKPLTITARLGTRVVRIRLPADSGPGEIYPSQVDLPESGCWQLTLTWNAHRARIDVQVD